MEKKRERDKREIERKRERLKDTQTETEIERENYLPDRDRKRELLACGGTEAECIASLCPCSAVCGPGVDWR